MINKILILLIPTVWLIILFFSIKHSLIINTFFNKMNRLLRYFSIKTNFIKNIKDKSYLSNLNWWMEKNLPVHFTTKKTIRFFWDIETLGNGWTFDSKELSVYDNKNREMNIPDNYTPDPRTRFGDHKITWLAFIPEWTEDDINKFNYNGKAFDMKDQLEGKLFEIIWENSHFNTKNFWYAHFSRGFDTKFILNSFQFILNKHKSNMEDHIKIVMKGRKIYQLEIYWKRKFLIFKDSYLIINSPLSSFKDNFKLSITKSTPLEMGWEKYCLHDVLVLKQGFLKARLTILEASGIDIFNVLTLPQLSAKCMNLKDTYKYFGKNAYWFIRQSFKGGRSQPFQKYGKDLNYYDFTSMYPSVMHDKVYPHGDYTPVSKNRPERVKFNLFDKYLGVWHISGFAKRIDITPFIRSVLYTRKGVDITGTSFAGGEFRGIWTSIDIKSAIKAKVISDFTLHKGIIWEKSYNPFASSIEKFFSERVKAKLNKNVVLDWFYKIVLNSAYGKLAQPPIKITQKIKNKHSLLKNLTERKSVFEEYHFKKYSAKNIRLATFITAYARERLYDEMKNINPKNLYYCDTDRIITTEDIKNEPGLGKLKLEKRFKEGIFLSPKNYLLKDDNTFHIRTKGFNRLRYDEKWLWEESKKIKSIYLVQELTSWKNMIVRWTLNHRLWSKYWWRNPSMKPQILNAPNAIRKLNWLNSPNNAASNLKIKYNNMRWVMKNKKPAVNKKLPHHK